ncbi:Na(+)/H(+) antiporter subunit C [Glaciihabitans arcticus]|uniref:Na(+)/H(+) antiporter subunit C n=1 Tax=Glaciihabitans arcticus TaxID=2668039 RepID=A0A4Q9GV34_9MICO|nr:Na(+)/H(+) antiporter subunit C [Glaciihabitans arcticus]TBN56040.1 Na(+)/H(+) antiporter subunit C [Glaciihabitans arcticus]
MSVSLVLLVVMAVLYACGIYLMLERSMTRVLLGFLLVGNATNLLILIMAGAAGVAPIVEDGVGADSKYGAEEMTDPLPQALILTAIVITFAVSAFLLALIYRSWRLAKEDDLDDDEDDVAMRVGSESLLFEERDDGTEGDTEFGTRAQAAISEAAELEHHLEPPREKTKGAKK